MSNDSIEPETQPDIESKPLLAPAPLPPDRLASIDAYRGLVMFLMMAEVLNLCQVASRASGNRLLGAAMPTSVARRMGGLLAPRLDSAVVLVSGWRRLAVLVGRAGWLEGSRKLG